MYANPLRFSILLLTVCVGCSESTPPPVEAMEKAAPLSSPSNLVLITIDTLRADHLGCYGYSRNTSPELDALAGRGVRFDQSLVQWPKTGPSVASMMTSTYGSTSGVKNVTGRFEVPPDYDLLAEVLQEAGYTTIGSVTNGSLSSQLRYDQGFDQYKLHLGNDKGDAVLEYGLQGIESCAPGERFFLWLHFLDPHTPYDPEPALRDAFVGDTEYVNDTRPLAEIRPGGDGVGYVREELLVPGAETMRDCVTAYDAEIVELDRRIGRFLDWLAARPELGSTMIVMTADHGEGLGEHGYYFSHGTLPYDDCVRVPLILFHEELEPQVISEPVALLDLAPTILEGLGLEPAWQSEGVSFWRELRNPQSRPIERPVFTESSRFERFTVSVRVGDYKLIKISHRPLAVKLTGSPYELYHIGRDPGELHNLVDEEPEVFAELRELLDDHVDEAYRKRGPAQDLRDEVASDVVEDLAALGYVDDR